MSLQMQSGNPPVKNRSSLDLLTYWQVSKAIRTNQYDVEVVDVVITNYLSAPKTSVWLAHQLNILRELNNKRFK